MEGFVFPQPFCLLLISTRFLYTLFTLAFVMGMLLAVVACFAMTLIFIQGLEASSGGIEREVHRFRTVRRNMVSRIDRGVVQVKIRLINHA